MALAVADGDSLFKAQAASEQDSAEVKGPRAPGTIVVPYYNHTVPVTLSGSGQCVGAATGSAHTGIDKLKART